MRRNGERGGGVVWVWVVEGRREGRLFCISDLFSLGDMGKGFIEDLISIWGWGGKGFYLEVFVLFFVFRKETI